MRYLIALILAAVSLSVPSAHAATEIPDLESAEVLAESEMGNVVLQLKQVPKRPMVYVPTRFFLVAVGGSSQDAIQSLDGYRAATFKPINNPEAAIGYGQKTTRLARVSDRIAEFRETFRYSGSFQILIPNEANPRQDLDISAQTSPQPYQLVPFSFEFPLFVACCLALGVILFCIYRRLEAVSTPPESHNGISQKAV